ncbi:MAG: helix-turn-helix transcriptional regulator [Ruminococcaceae bacterium]|nr:helix-turn-helix transcriptional regulator [Oscillospiraceae bacterium]
MKTHANIKSFREQMGLSQEELALKVGYKDRSSIAKIEAGLVDLTQSKIVAFASALCVSPAELMGISAEPPGNLLPIPKKISDNCRRPSVEEGYAHILRGLISYHERMTMGDIPQKDFYLDALKFALTCVEKSNGCGAE